MEKCLVIIKPGAVARNLVGRVIAAMEATGATLLAMRMGTPKRRVVEVHYMEHIEQPFFSRLTKDMCAGPVVVMNWGAPKGVQLIPKLRALAGATDPVKAAPGSLRGQFGLDITHNVVHVSDSSEAVVRESALWLEVPEEEVFVATHASPLRSASALLVLTRDDPEQ
jgi:nucleoside-diphosphate kinase